jgi:hypothetical protein
MTRHMEEYPVLTEDEVKTLVVDDKWLTRLDADVHGEMDRMSQSLTQRVKEQAERYAMTMSQLSTRVGPIATATATSKRKLGLVNDSGWKHCRQTRADYGCNRLLKWEHVVHCLAEEVVDVSGGCRPLTRFELSSHDVGFDQGWIEVSVADDVAQFVGQDCQQVVLAWGDVVEISAPAVACGVGV